MGNAPQIGEEVFFGVTATAYYPANDSSWTEEIRQSYGGKITWVARAGSPTGDGSDGTSAMRQSAISEEVHELFQKASVGDASAQNAFAFGRHYFEDDGKDSFVEPDAVVSIKPEEEDTGNTEPAEVVKVRSVLQEMHQIRLGVEDETISAGISRVEEIGQKIVEYIRNHPERIPQARQFINVYVPLTINIFKNYATLSRVGISGKNVDAGLSDVPRTMGLIISAFERQLDKLFDSEALDIASDISVMKHMLEQDGFVGGLEV